MDTPREIAELISVDSSRLEEAQSRVNAFLGRLRESPLYRIDDLDIYGEAARKCLDETTIIYAQGSCNMEAVESAARAFAEACKVKRPQNHKGNNEPPPREYQHKQTYNYQQYHVTGAQKQARKLMEARDAENRRISEEIFQNGLEYHLANYPDCKNLHCPYCNEVAKNANLV